jgi:transcriptional regulator
MLYFHGKYRATPLALWPHGQAARLVLRSKGMADDETAEKPEEQDRRVLALRENGASWLDIQRALGLTRQQARYAYQRAKREERRAQRRGT